MTDKNGSTSAFVRDLEIRLQKRSDELEDLHMEAAIDAQLTQVDNGNPVIARPVAGKSSSSSLSSSSSSLETRTQEKAIFDDYSNPHSVQNCLGPYIPTEANRIDAFCTWVSLSSDDTLLDIGCGDGRVCLAASKLTGCRSIGLDISPLCIPMAQQIAKEERLQNLCQFHEVDATINPDLLLTESSPIASILKQVTVVFLYTYPSFLVQLVPLLHRLNQARTVVTLTYHLSDQTIEKEDFENDFRMYNCIQHIHSNVSE